MKISPLPSAREIDLPTLVSNADSPLTYAELSRCFNELYPTVLRAFQLIELMYTRLTLVEKLKHREAIKKIYDDHKHLAGFSRRNIYRYLPSGNPNVPKRVVPSRHKSSLTEPVGNNKFSSTKLSSQPEGIPEDEIHGVEPIRESSEVECHRCILLTAKNQELEEALLASSRCTRANNLIASEIDYQIPKEKMYLLTEAMKKYDKACFTIFDNTGNLVYAIADLDRMKNHVSPDGKN